MANTHKSPVAQPPPKWAVDLVDRAAAYLGASRRPVVIWHSSRDPVPAYLDSPRKRSLPIAGVRYPVADLSGAYTHIFPPFAAESGDIEVWPGRARRDQRLVLLHEIAHWYVPGHRHDARFWTAAWSLYRKFMPRSLDYVLGREAIYRTGALRAAIKAGIVGAEAAYNNPHLRRAVALRQGK